MESDDPKRRRPLEDAASAWRSPTGTPLTELATKQGWTTNAGRLRVSPAPERARTVARHGMSADEHARKRREEMVSANKRKEIAGLVTRLASDLSDLELRYLRDVITLKLAKPRG
jgi:hypothetical protein